MIAIWVALTTACLVAAYRALARRALADARWRHHMRQGIRQWRTGPLYAAKRDANDMGTWTLILIVAWCGALLFGYLAVAAGIEALGTLVA